MSLFKRLWSSKGSEPAATSSEAPVQEYAATDLGWPARERRLRKRLNAKRGLSALIIDDSPTIVAALGKTLRSAGYITIAAGDAESGLALAQQGRPSLIFLDILLPGMNGFAALRLLRKNPVLRDTPVIMISGNEHATEQFYASRIGADDFMKKPFARIEIFSRIESLLDAELVPRRRNAAVARPAPAIVADPLPPAVAPSAELSAAASMLAARKELTAMGLKYFDQAQYDAAVQRNDQLAISLFIRAGAIKPGAMPGTGNPQVDLASLPTQGKH